ncbi:PIG-L deacetylase family protein [Elusimicrobiota bacterium]
MGGAIRQLTGKGTNVKVVNLTDGEPTPCGSSEIRQKESLESASILGFEQEILEYKNRDLKYDIEKRNKIAQIIRYCKPLAIFTHFSNDSHPDHSETSKIVDDAVFAARLTNTDIPGEPFRPRKVYYYFAVHLKKVIEPDFFITLTEEEHSLKMRALEAYKSQFIDNKDNEKVFEYIRTRDRYWGFIAGSEYAEGFMSREAVNIDSIGNLI